MERVPYTHSFSSLRRNPRRYLFFHLIIGQADLPDLFLPPNRLAEDQLDLLMTAGANVEKKEID